MSTATEGNNDGGSEETQLHSALQQRWRKIQERVAARAKQQVEHHCKIIEQNCRAKCVHLAETLQADVQARHLALQAQIQRETAQLQTSFQHAGVFGRAARNPQQEVAALQEKHRHNYDLLQGEIQSLHEALNAQTEALKRHAEADVRMAIALAQSEAEYTVEKLTAPLPEYQNLAVPYGMMLRFITDGYVIMKDAVSQELRRDALRVINATLGNGFTKSEIATFRRPTAETSAPILNLVTHSPVLGTAQAFIGPTSPCFGGQLAIRFPGAMCQDFDLSEEAPVLQPVHPNSNAWWHIDGFDKPGSLNSFTMLIGVYLNDLPDGFCGNLVVFPGSHLELSRHFGTELVHRSPKDIVERGFKHSQTVSLSGQPNPLVVRAGDVVLCHYLLAHSIAPNLAPDVRYAVYFRLHAKGIERRTLGQRVQALADPWGDFTSPAFRVAVADATMKTAAP